MRARDVIVIGASAGGFEALQRLVAGFPRDLQAAVFVSLHLSERSANMLPGILNRAGPLPASTPWEDSPIQMGRIYVAPPDCHLILKPDSVHVGHGPRENLQRPCINVMFRSAASCYQERVAGVLLTGLLDDGAAGLWEIQQRGGTTVVQDPAEAAYPSMPESAIRGLKVEYIVRLAEIAPLLTRLTMGDKDNARREDFIEPVLQLSGQACPECGGVMRVTHLGGPREYRCHIGHRFGLKTMIAEKSDVVEKAIGTALAQSEELSRLLQEVQAELDPETSQLLAREITQRKEEQQILRKLVERVKKPPLGD
jgi:two-component system, chemotaxis family, protein-glutamate methylesterase/glutaminase